MHNNAAEDSTRHEGRIDIGEVSNIGATVDVGDVSVRFVHYPGSQQLILWLPVPGRNGYGDLIIRREDGLELDRAKVADRMNGSVQILCDTLSWPPGHYTIGIAHDGGWSHRVRFTKHPPDPAGTPTAAVASTGEREAVRSEEVPTPTVYRDGFGNIVPDQDLILRRELHQTLLRRFSRRLSYDGNGRSGKVVYTDGDHRIEFFHEIAAAPYKWLIEVPRPDRWQAVTGTSLAEREEILRFVAETAQRDQAGSWHYEIRADCILYFAPGYRPG